MMKEGEHPLGGNYIMACRDLFQEVITFVFLMSISDCTWPRKPLHPDMWRWKSVKSLSSRHGIYQQKRKRRRDASFLNAPPLMGMVTDKDIWKVGLLSRIHFTWPIPSRIPSTIKWKCTDKKDLQNGMRWQKRTIRFEMSIILTWNTTDRLLPSVHLLWWIPTSHEGNLHEVVLTSRPPAADHASEGGHESDINMAAFVLIILPPSVHPVRIVILKVTGACEAAKTVNGSWYTRWNSSGAAATTGMYSWVGGRRRRPFNTLLSPLSSDPTIQMARNPWFYFVAELLYFTFTRPASSSPFTIYDSNSIVLTSFHVSRWPSSGETTML